MPSVKDSVFTVYIIGQPVMYCLRTDRQYPGLEEYAAERLFADKR